MSYTIRRENKLFETSKTSAAKHVAHTYNIIYYASGNLEGRNITRTQTPDGAYIYAIRHRVIQALIICTYTRHSITRTHARSNESCSSKYI